MIIHVMSSTRGEVNLGVEGKLKNYFEKGIVRAIYEVTSWKLMGYGGGESMSRPGTA